jgi:hypothetical protein
VVEAKIKTPIYILVSFLDDGRKYNNRFLPQCGEIDILEQKGQESHITYSTIHALVTQG